MFLDLPGARPNRADVDGAGKERRLPCQLPRVRCSGDMVCTTGAAAGRGEPSSVVEDVRTDTVRCFARRREPDRFKLPPGDTECGEKKCLLLTEEVVEPAGDMEREEREKKAREE